ncbi:MAG TPA: ROK family protein [bacterium]|nr:ROK family protein [bacterium]HPR88264.1 ROK family protein [bacterium]
MGKEKRDLVIGIDLGGTKIYAAVIDRKGSILGSERKKTKAELGFPVTVTRMAECARAAAATAGLPWEAIRAIGVGSPGPLDLKKGLIIETPNLAWKEAPLRKELKKLLKKPVYVDNDCNVGLLGEYTFGAARGARDVVGFFVGTGIGGGVIIGGRLVHGFNENAGELGHIILDPHGPACGCGNQGCLEAFSSRLAIEREIRRAIAAGTPSAVLDDAGASAAPIRSRRLLEAYLANDAAVVPAINRSAEYLGYATAAMLNIFNPEVVVIGGGVVEALGDLYVNRTREIAVKNCFAIASRNVRITAASLKDDSGVLGAAVLAWSHLH